MESNTGNQTVQEIIVLGGGSAGLIAAISLKKKNPLLKMEVIRSKAIGVIGVGEGTTAFLPRFFREFLELGERRFFETVQPTWKLGLRFKWGPGAGFCYPFDDTFIRQHPQLPKIVGFYAGRDMEASTPVAALMEQDRVFARDRNGVPVPHPAVGYHLENHRLVEYLENFATRLGVVLKDDKIVKAEQDENGISALVLASGPRVRADLYVDCSGFVSTLLNGALTEPFISFKPSLQNNRAVVGGWMRAGEVIQPYTACDTMTSGWCWQIDHEDCVNCGYVYSSDFLSDGEAEAEFRRYKPKVSETSLVKFVTGRYERAWVKNVVAIGNSSGFVEPLESTGLAVVCLSSALLAQTLAGHDRIVRAPLVEAFNRQHQQTWDEIRDFLSIHFRFNSQMDTPYWEYCREKTDVAGAAGIIEYYQECGPSACYTKSNLMTSLANQFGLNGYYVLLLGQGVPFKKTHVPLPEEWNRWELLREQNRTAARNAIDTAGMMAYMRSAQWKWMS